MKKYGLLSCLVGVRIFFIHLSSSISDCEWMHSPQQTRAGFFLSLTFVKPRFVSTQVVNCRLVMPPPDRFVSYSTCVHSVFNNLL